MCSNAVHEPTPKTIVARLDGISAVARLCECTPSAVWQWIEAGAIPRARELYLEAIRPDAFADEPEQQQAEPTA